MQTKKDHGYEIIVDDVKKVSTRKFRAKATILKDGNTIATVYGKGRSYYKAGKDAKLNAYNHKNDLFEKTRKEGLLEQIETTENNKDINTKKGV